MADITETAIAAIAAKIASETGEDAIPMPIGSKYVQAHATPPRVVWTEEKSPIDPAKRAGHRGQAEIGIDRCQLKAHIWHDSRENARILMHNIIAAARKLYPTVVRFTGYTPMDDQSTAHAAKGQGFVLDCEMLIKVPEYIQTTTTITTVSGDAIAELPAGDETYASTSQT